MNRFRDYLVELRHTPMTGPAFRDLGQPGKSAEPTFEKQTLTGHSRVRLFWGGVYKRFYVDTPGGYHTVRVNRNHSFNTILSGIFVDAVGAPPARQSRQAQIEALKLAETSTVALSVLDRLLYLRESNARWYAGHRRRYVLPLLRYMLDEANGPCPAERLEPKFPLRRELAACLGDVQWFERRDAVWYDQDWQNTYDWLMTTKHGRKMWEFDPDAYFEFVDRMNASKGWGNPAKKEPK